MEQVPAFKQNINKNAFFNIIFKNKIVKIFMIRIFYSEKILLLNRRTLLQ